MSRKVKVVIVKKEFDTTVGRVIGTILCAIINGLFSSLRFLAKTGLIITVVYIIFGAILYGTAKFNPFLFDALGTLYLCGLIACVLGTAVIAIRFCVKDIVHGYKQPLYKKRMWDDGMWESEWERRKRQKQEEKLSPPEIEKFRAEKIANRYGDLTSSILNFEPTVVSDSERKKQDWVSEKNKTVNQTQPKIEIREKEMPKVYLSQLQPDVLIHEYEDRFELHKVNGNNLILMGVEYK